MGRIVEFSAGGKGSDGTENWHKRRALQIVAQLPDELKDAVAILAFAEQLLQFLEGPTRA
ncbi:MAG: hypothetical protein AB7F39_06770 [Variibacter sp.]